MDRTCSAIILAGGDGTRLRTLTRELAGDDRPKQFCRVLGRETLLEQTRRRARRLSPAAATLVVVNRAHAPFYGPALADVDPAAVIAQPANRGTAPAVLAALLRLERLALTGPVAILPSDHYVSDDDAFMARVGGAVEAVRERVDRVVLLGIAPDRPEPEYGWIEPGRLIPGPWCWPVYAVERFWEKPAAAAAQRLERQGCLWNSFVMVADPAALAALIAAASPALARAFEPVRSAPAGRGEDDAMRAAYASLSPTDLSRDVLQARPGALAVLPVSGVDWNDLGDPARVAATRARAEQVAVPA